MRFLKPAEITAFFLVFLYVLAVALKSSPLFFTSELIRVATLTFTFILPTFIFIKLSGKKMQWDNSLITVLLLLLLADPAAPVLLTAVLGILTFLFKVIIRIQSHPVFNPAAASLSVAYLFGLTTTWWGVSFAPRFFSVGMSSALLFTLPLGLYIIKKYKKLPTLAATVLTLLIGNVILQGTVQLPLILEGTFAFFLLIMATEPKTTPLLDSEEWVYGVLLGGSLAIWFYYKFPLPYLLNLVILNALFSLFKFSMFRFQLRRAIA